MPESILKYFQFSEPSSGPGSINPGSPQPLVLGVETPLASIKLKHIHQNDLEFFTATVGWRFVVPSPSPPFGVASELMFRIRRDSLIGSIVFVTTDTGFLPPAPGINHAYTASFNHTETGIEGHNHNYFLTATLLSDYAIITGPVVFNGLVIGKH
ncbi:MAG: hypothetical protein ACYDEJ_03050 [Desulfitobacteriaceae bacterium]